MPCGNRAKVIFCAALVIPLSIYGVDFLHLPGATTPSALAELPVQLPARSPSAYKEADGAAEVDAQAQRASTEQAAVQSAEASLQAAPDAPDPHAAGNPPDARRDSHSASQKTPNSPAQDSIRNTSEDRPRSNGTESGPPAGQQAQRKSWNDSLELESFEETFRVFDSLCCAGRLEPSEVKLLIIVTDVARERAYRDVHRRTWMARPGVCPLNASASRAEPPGCGAFACFAVGKDRVTDVQVAEEGRQRGDMLILDVADPFSNHVVSAGGFQNPRQDRVKKKTQGALRTASRLFPWLTHIAKNDLDNFPWVHAVVLDLRNPLRVGSTFRTRRPDKWSEVHGGLYYGLGMGDPDTMVSAMQGQFYVISQSLLTCTFQVCEPSMCHGRNGEDSQIGCQIRVASRPVNGKPNKCPEPMQVDVGFKHKRWLGCKPDHAATRKPKEPPVSREMFQCKLSESDIRHWKETISRAEA